MRCGDDIIIAPASPPGRSRRALIRLSGSNLSPLIDALLDRPLRPRALTACRMRVSAIDPSREARWMPVLASTFPPPRSFTAEHVLEIQLPGNPALVERVVHDLIGPPRSSDARRTVRLAEPGEFTRRAFLAGKFDLTRAEGIAATIGAETDAQMQASQMLRRGQLGQWAESLVDRLAQLLALVEAGIDFTDQEDVTPIAPAALDTGLSDVHQQVTGMTARSRAWSDLQGLPWVVLVGAPNVGKTTLFNALLGYERAVATPIAGTTRDVLCEPLRLTLDDEQEAEVMLVDLAGLEQPETALQRAAQAAARDAIERAELLLCVSDDSSDSPPTVSGEEGGAVATQALRIHTKADTTDLTEACDVSVSAVTGQGLDALRRCIAECLRGRAVALSGQMLALQPRHAEALGHAAEQLDLARGMLIDQRSASTLSDMELLAEPIRAALDHLGALGGRVSPDEVIGRVFATFCVGK